MLSLTSRPIRTVMAWQIFATVLMTLLAGYLSGMHGAISGALGGIIGIVGGLAFTWQASRGKGASADSVLFAALKAEGLKILVFILLLTLVLVTYKNAVALGLIGAGVVSTLIFSFAFFVRDASSERQP
jgi:ATP synthase protein I